METDATISIRFDNDSGTGIDTDILSLSYQITLNQHVNAHQYTHQTHTCTHTLVCTSTHTGTHTSIDIHISTYMYKRINIQIPTATHIYTHIFHKTDKWNLYKLEDDVHFLIKLL